MKKHRWGEAKRKVIELTDGTRNYQEIAAAAGVSREYVAAAVRRLGIRDKVASPFRNRKKHIPDDLKGYLAVKVDDLTRQSIIDRALASGVTVGEICGTLLAVAVDVGDLDTHFPVESP
jgi:hypothetical protein